jgi:hypothetical protein
VSYTNQTPHCSEILSPSVADIGGHLPQLHLIEQSDRHGQTVPLRIEADVGRADDVARHATIVSGSNDAHARVIPARNQKSSPTEGLYTIELSIS